MSRKKLPGLLLILLTAANFCYAHQKTVEVVGIGECDDCQPHDIQNSHAVKGLRVSVDCKQANGEIKTRGSAELDDEGKFRVEVPQELVENGKLKEECYAQLRSASNTLCTTDNEAEFSKIAFVSESVGKQTFSPAGKLKFSPLTCTLAFLWHKKPFPKIPPKKLFFKKPIPHIPIYKKPVPHPHVPIFKKPVLPPIPIYKKPLPPLHVPIYMKPLPPVPFYKKPLPPLLPIYKKPLPPIPVWKKKPLPPIPVWKKKPLPPIPVWKKKPLPPIPVFKNPFPYPIPVFKKPTIPEFKPKPLPPLPELPPHPLFPPKMSFDLPKFKDLPFPPHP